MSDYGRQLAEKQKAKRAYAMREAQFRRFFKEATASSVATGQALLSLLERRLDNVIFRAGMAKSRKMGRQLVTHGLVRVGGKKVTSPSYLVQPGDTVTLTRQMLFAQGEDAVVPNWLKAGKEQSVKVERLPKADDLVSDLDTQLIIEYYSR